MFVNYITKIQLLYMGSGTLTKNVRGSGTVEVYSTVPDPLVYFTIGQNVLLHNLLNPESLLFHCYVLLFHQKSFQPFDVYLILKL